MSRTTYIVPYTDAPTTVRNLKEILMQEKYDNVSEGGESVWKCGNGNFAAIKYIKYEFIAPNVLHIHGWVKSDVGGELNLDGILGGLPKKQVRAVISRLKAAVR